MGSRCPTALCALLAMAMVSFFAPGGDRGDALAQIGVGGGGKGAGIPELSLDLEDGSDFASVELLAARAVLSAERVTWMALRFEIEADWHLYWKFAGDTGTPPSWSWDVPEGVRIGSPVWPVPRAYSPASGILDYIHEDELVLLFPVTIERATAVRLAGEEDGVTVRGVVDWLVCKDVCLPGSGEVELDFAVGSGAGEAERLDASRVDARASALMARAWSRVPMPRQRAGAWGVETSWVAGDEGDEVVLELDAGDADGVRWYPVPARFAWTPVDRIGDTSAGGGRLEVGYRRAILDAGVVSGVLEIERGGSRVWIELDVATPRWPPER